MTETRTGNRRRNRAAFTLIEVLGAVAILGLSYIMLATSAIGGLRIIGESQRRIQASLVADQALTEIELAIEIGQPVDVGLDEWEVGPFVVEVEIIDMVEEYEGQALDDEPQDLVAFLVAEANGPFAPFREENLLLGFLREVHVSVRWQDAADELEVTRTAYLYDRQASSGSQPGSDPLDGLLPSDLDPELRRTISEALR